MKRNLAVWVLLGAALAGRPSATLAADAPIAAPAAAVAPEFTPLDLPDWVLLDDPAAAKARPWLLVVDDPQCPYCMALHLALGKLRAAGDADFTGATMARMPFPLAFHDQAAHIVADAFCLEATRATRPWSASSYLDWLVEGTWATEPGWETTGAVELTKADGLFEARYDAHRVTSSRRRDFQTEVARREAACESAGEGRPASCRGDADCESLCAEQEKCRAACTAPPAGASAPAKAPEACAADCAEKFVSQRYRQFSRVHSACLLAQGTDSAQAKTAAAYAWAIAHEIPGTPTLFVGHPALGFHQVADAADYAGLIANLRADLAAARARLAAAPRR